jgi:large subunit ribosomal protein L29
MAYIVELRGMSDEQLEDRLENAREELFNLRFQQASARLENTSRIRAVRREIAQLQEALHKRRLPWTLLPHNRKLPKRWTIASGTPMCTSIMKRHGWIVSFRNPDGGELARAIVDLNRKRARPNASRMAAAGSRQELRSDRVGDERTTETSDRCGQQRQDGEDRWSSM